MLPLLVINRGYGVGSYNFNHCIINKTDTIEYLIENHLICIKSQSQLPNDQLIDKYNAIIQSLKPKQEFIKLYFGNNAINTTELCEILQFIICKREISVKSVFFLPFYRVIYHVIIFTLTKMVRKESAKKKIFLQVLIFVSLP